MSKNIPETTSQRVDRSQSRSKREKAKFALFGVTLRGPTTEEQGAPVSLKSETDIENHCGLSGANNLLVQELNILVNAGAELLFTNVVHSGTVATLTLLDALAEPCLRVDALFYGPEGHNITAKVENDPSDAVNFYNFTIGYSTQTGLGKLFPHAAFDRASGSFVEGIVNGVSKIVTVTQLKDTRPVNIVATALAGGAKVITGIDVDDYEDLFPLYDGYLDITHMASYTPTIGNPTDSILQGQVVAAMKDYVSATKTRRDFLVIDGGPKGLDSDDLVNYRLATGGYGWESIDDPFVVLYAGDPKLRKKGSYGATAQYNLTYVLAQFARKYADGYPWDGVAGENSFGEIPKATGVSKNWFNKAAHATLVANQINPIIFDRSAKESAGAVLIYDDLTLQKSESLLSWAHVIELLNWMTRRWRYWKNKRQFKANNPTTWKYIFMGFTQDMDGAEGPMENEGCDGWAYDGDQHAVTLADCKVNDPDDLADGKYKARVSVAPYGLLREAELTIIVNKTAVEFEVTV